MKIKKGNLNYDQSGRAYPDEPHIEENWDYIWEHEGKYYKLVGDNEHKEWDEIKIIEEFREKLIDGFVKGGVPRKYLDKKYKFMNDDLISHYTTPHGWVDYVRLNEELEERNYRVKELVDNNRTDGQLHYNYINDNTGESYELNANYWDVSSFDGFREWLAKQ